MGDCEWQREQERRRLRAEMERVRERAWQRAVGMMRRFAESNERAVLAGVLFFWYESRMQQRGRTRIAHDAHLGGALVGVAWVVLFVPSAIPRFIQALQGLLP